MDRTPKFQIKPGRFSVGMSMEAGSSDVWRIITDTSLWPQWGPSVLDVKCSDRFILYGTKGFVKTVMGFSPCFYHYIFKKKKENGHGPLAVSTPQGIALFQLMMIAVCCFLICRSGPTLIQLSAWLHLIVSKSL